MEDGVGVDLGNRATGRFVRVTLVIGGQLNFGLLRRSDGSDAEEGVHLCK